MQSRLSTLQSRISKLNNSLLVEEGHRAAAERTFVALDLTVKSLTQRERLLTQVELALAEVAQKVMNQSIMSIDRLVTMGLRAVFDDVDLDFKAVVERYRGKTAVRFVLFQDGKEAPIMESYGGGVIVVAGVLLRIVTIMALEGRRFLVLDETLAHLSNQYVPSMSKLLNKLSSELHFTILMVTHNPEFAEYSQFHFQAVQKDGATVFEKVTQSGATE